MLFSKFAYSAIFVGSAVASLNERFVDDGFNALTKRQQFVPTTQTAAGDTCADAFGAGYQTCREKSDGKNRLCYNPTVGQTCCSASYACPNGSFCLVDPFCCPNGSDPKTCAADKGVELPSSFASAASSTAPKSSSAPAPSAVYFAQLNQTVTASSSSSYHVPYPSTNATTVVKPIATGAYTSSPAPFTGAASHASMSFGIAFAGILAAMATLF
ncbi:hypothetical protein EJ08DRAFT_691310 [Tothia fuscella]|uniref:GPI anchored serine-threonine rich protein n=1 Tax=Tothia fuscella TaxID=1048955 RepID=A0A9P4P4B8_9PEZI|nr:hypothetical protein EJ08DRAFT_691310 [Tothia fuscella]